jgi:hypothetical protein
VLRQLDTCGHFCSSDLSGVDVTHQRQPSGETRSMLRKLLCEAADRPKRSERPILIGGSFRFLEKPNSPLRHPPRRQCRQISFENIPMKMVQIQFAHYVAGDLVLILPIPKMHLGSFKIIPT